MGSIGILQESLRNMIAAGEVVERPSSALKELVENSLDAGARRIDVEIAGGGKGLIRVGDDGRGMDADDLSLCVERHATSKISSAEGLSQMRTLGFRGEALPSIARVSKLTIATRRAGEPSGLKLVVDRGKKKGPFPWGLAPGTVVEVRELFKGVPAREKFLRSVRAESSSCGEVATRMALSRPDVAARYSVSGRTVFELEPSELPTRVRRLLKLEGELADMRWGEEGWMAARGVVALDEKRRTRSAVYIFVNGRYVRDQALAHAVSEGCRDVIPQGLHPAAVVMLELEPSLVDVNVHPAKIEVRFKHPREVFLLVMRAVREAVRSARPAVGAGLRAPEDAVQGPPERQPACAGLQLRPAPAEKSPRLGAHAPAGRSLSVREGARLAGRLSNGLALIECDEEILILDPHALHERLIYERLRSERSSAGQKLLVPEPVELAPGARERFEEMMPFFLEAGFEIEEFGPDSWLIAAVPALLGGSAREAVLAAMEEHTPRETYREAVLRALACRGAVKTSAGLPDSELTAVLRLSEERFGSVRAPELASCPHGRPTLLRMTFEEIRRRLARR